jgi:hypothetical protein
MNIEFVSPVICSYSCTEVSGSILALTSDPNLANNFSSVMFQPVAGFKAYLGAPPNLFVYRSDAPREPPSGLLPTADSALTVWIPPVQTYLGNIWYFDSWADGDRDDPRTFDASNGISPSQGDTNFHIAFPFGVNPGSLDLVALPGKAPLPQAVTLTAPYGPGTWTIGNPAASWLKLNTELSPDLAEVVTGTADLSGLAPGYYTTTFPAQLVAAGVSSSQDVPFLYVSWTPRRPLYPMVSSTRPVIRRVPSLHLK